MKKYRLCIFGSRTLHPTDTEISAAIIKKLGYTLEEIGEVVWGGAYGVDDCAKRWADNHNIPTRLFAAEWDLYGKAAGHKRNREMAKYCDAGLGFWDGVSSGTANMVCWLEVHDKVFWLVHKE